VSKNNQPIPATDAAQNFNKLSKDQLKHFVNLDVSFSEMLFRTHTMSIHNTSLLMSLMDENFLRLKMFEGSIYFLSFAP